MSLHPMLPDEALGLCILVSRLAWKPTIVAYVLQKGFT